MTRIEILITFIVLSCNLTIFADICGSGRMWNWFSRRLFSSSKLFNMNGTYQCLFDCFCNYGYTLFFIVHYHLSMKGLKKQRQSMGHSKKVPVMPDGSIFGECENIVERRYTVKTETWIRDFLAAARILQR